MEVEVEPTLNGQTAPWVLPLGRDYSMFAGGN